MNKQLAWAVWILAAVIFLTAACTTVTTQQNLHTTALSLKALHAQYKAAQPIMDSAYTQKLITRENYENWAAFAKAYEQWFPETVQLWEGALLANNHVSQGNISAAVISMGARLTALTGAVIDAATKKKGS